MTWTRDDVKRMKEGEYLDMVASLLGTCDCGSTEFNEVSYLSHFMFGEVEYECEQCGHLRLIQLPRQ